jgi:hypothetical protein
VSAPRRPLGIFLAGGGALGAWQIGALGAFAEAGLVFDRVMGFSIGAFNGAAVAFDYLDTALKRWHELDGGVLKLRPRLWPHFSLSSDDAVRGLFELAHDDARARALIRRPLCVVGAVPSEGAAEYAEFWPEGRWHGPLEAWLRATSAIPGIFPPVRIGAKTYVDGGVPMPAPFRLDFFTGCSEVWILEMVRPDEVGLKRWRDLNPYYGLDHGGREACRSLVDDGVASLSARPDAPRVRRLHPSRRLDSVMLDFSAKAVKPMLALGAADAKAFLAGE